jgi:hypothetical protein
VTKKNIMTSEMGMCGICAGKGTFEKIWREFLEKR